MKNFVLESIKKIQDAINKNKLVLFIGAGVSTNSGLPNWKELIDNFSESIGKKANNYSDKDYLRIPQYYYNERGKKEYYDVITKIFAGEYKPNLIHELLLDLNPIHIITTNFDNLLEQMVRIKGEFFDVVKQNSDLPYTPNSRMIIKMHGDLELKNIILKEDDFLSYSNNFILIENFIKSLFATHVILFVGYSLNDPDVQLIFQWIKDILKEDFQPAYFLKIDKEKSEKEDRIDFEYYKKKGINILYYSAIEELTKNFEVKSRNFSELLILNSDIGRKLYKFLKLIKEYEVKFKNITDMFYEKLQIFDMLNSIR
ncbi:MAG: SIR2 family protein, partial [Candidatus Eremiobacterota bacterium]